MRGQDIFEVRGLFRVKMQAFVVHQQPQRRLARPAGKQRPEQCVFDAHHRQITLCGHGQPTVGCARVAPDSDGVTYARHSQMQAIARQLQNAPYPAVGDEPAVKHKKPPVLCRAGGGSIVYFRP